jgi:hypothetical protein
MRAELFHADGRKDMIKIIVAFRNFADAPKNQLIVYREIIAISSEIHTKQINTAVWAERRNV